MPIIVYYCLYLLKCQYRNNCRMSKVVRHSDNLSGDASGCVSENRMSHFRKTQDVMTKVIELLKADVRKDYQWSSLFPGCTFNTRRNRCR